MVLYPIIIFTPLIRFDPSFVYNPIEHCVFCCTVIVAKDDETKQENDKKRQKIKQKIYLKRTQKAAKMR